MIHFKESKPSKYNYLELNWDVRKLEFTAEELDTIMDVIDKAVERKKVMEELEKL